MGAAATRPRLRPSLLCGVLLLALQGCSAIEPVPYYDHREEGPRRGLLSGEAGGFVVEGRDEKRERARGGD